MKKICGFTYLMTVCVMLSAQTYPVTFDNLPLPNQENVWKGQDQSGGFISNGLRFRNTYDSTWDYWTGAAYSNVQDKTTAGFGNQFASYAGGGINKTSQYATLTENARIVMEKKSKISGMYISNSTYAALSMKNGDAFAKKFGGISGNDKDYFILKAYGLANGQVVDSAQLHLADYTFTDNASDYILSDWTWLDLSQWPMIDSLYFDYESSDTGKFGINTPKYFCVDDINGASPQSIITHENFETFGLDSSGHWNGNTARGGFLTSNMYFENNYNPDWQSWSGWAVSDIKDTLTRGFDNQYSVISGSGNNNSDHYLVGYGSSTIRLPYNDGIATTGNGLAIMVNNSTYAYYSMREGDAFSKKFGGTTGNDPDYFKLLIKGYDKAGYYIDSVEFYLADFRFSNNADDYIVKDWTQVDISKLVLNRAIRLEFSLSSSDNGSFGMNTPAFFCVDDVMHPTTGSVAKMKSENIGVYPNPAKDNLYIQLEGQAKATVYDLNGQIVLANESADAAAINISALKPGVYFIQLEKEGKQYHAKFVKQ